jgi:predicted peptidase
MRGCIALLLLLTGTSWLAAQSPATGFVNRTHTNPDGTKSPYVLFIPAKYDGKTPVPVILSLHGSGETKGGKKQPVEVGLGTVVKKQAETFPAIVIFPQSEKRTWKAGSDDANRALAILETVQKEFTVDPNRVYLTGLSMGGYGTWSLAAAHPEKWAAIVPICGGGNPADAAKFKDIPCWAFHGDKDPAVKVEKSREMIAALKAAGGTPKYTEYPGVNHFSWDPAYATDELYTWLFAQKRPSR